MRTSSKSHSKNHCSIYNSTGTHRGKDTQALRNIMSSIKYLQQRVSYLPDYQVPKKPRPTPSTPKMVPKQKSSLAKHNTTSNRKRELSAKTKRTTVPKRQSMVVNSQSKTCKMRKEIVVDVQETQEKPDLLENYMSLQLENFKLEKQNLNLEKQLLEQQLIMERREKQLLKHRLKRIKTQHQESQRTTPQQLKFLNTSKTHNYSNPSSNISKKTKVSAFQISPIKIKIPQLDVKDQENLYCSIPVKKKSDKAEDDIDSLLLSEESEKRKSEEALVIDQQLWELLGQNKSKSSTTRDVLGDIANRPKMLRRR